MTDTSPPRFVVLTGFLGSGKTTLLRDFLDSPEAVDTAFIVNEAGEIGLDGAILADGGGEVRMAMLSNGCVCCEGPSDLAVAVEALLAADRPGASGPLKCIVLETSGLSKPGPILRSLATLAEHRMPVSVIATYDAEQAPVMRGHREALAQWAAAQTIILTKTDRVSPERRSAALREARSINPLAEVIDADNRRQAFAAALRLGRATGFGISLPQPGGDAHPDVSVLLATFKEKPDFDDLATWLDNLAGLLGERLLRLKGLVRVNDGDLPVLIQSVGTLFSSPRPFRDPEPGERSFLVIIGIKITAADIAAVVPALAVDMLVMREGRHESV